MTIQPAAPAKTHFDSARSHLNKMVLNGIAGAGNFAIFSSGSFANAPPTAQLGVLALGLACTGMALHNLKNGVLAVAAHIKPPEETAPTTEQPNPVTPSLR